MAVSRRQLLQGVTASVGLLSMPAVVRRSLAEEFAPPPLRGGEILPDPDFSLLRRSEPYVVGIRPHRAGGVRLELDEEGIASRHGSKVLIHNYGHGGPGLPLRLRCGSVLSD